MPAMRFWYLSILESNSTMHSTWLSILVLPSAVQGPITGGKVQTENPQTTGTKYSFSYTLWTFLQWMHWHKNFLFYSLFKNRLLSSIMDSTVWTVGLEGVIGMGFFFKQPFKKEICLKWNISLGSSRNRFFCHGLCGQNRNAIIFPRI